MTKWSASSLSFLSHSKDDEETRAQAVAFEISWISALDKFTEISSAFLFQDADSPVSYQNGQLQSINIDKTPL